MKKLVNLEIYKAFRNKYFRTSITTAIIVTLFNTGYVLKNYDDLQQMLITMKEYNISEIGNPYFPAFSSFSNWIGGEVYSLGYSLFFFLLPIFATLPYAWSVLEEKENGYIMQIAIRTDKRKYLFAKNIAIFLSGGACVVIPLIFNLGVTLCILPAVHPDSIYPYFGQNQISMWSDLFFKNPFCYIFLYLLLDFIFGGIFAILGASTFSLFHKKVWIILFPFIILVCVQYIASFFITTYEWSALRFLHPLTVWRDVNGYIVLGEAVFYLLSATWLQIYGVKKNEIW